MSADAQQLLSRRRAIGALAAFATGISLAACSQPASSPSTSGSAKPAASGQQTAPAGGSAQPVTIKFGRGLAAEEPLWTLIAKPDVAPNQGKVYTLEVTPFPDASERVKAVEAGALEGFQVAMDTLVQAVGQGIKIKALGSIMVESTQGFSTPLVAPKGSLSGIADLKGKTVGVAGFKTSTDLWAREAVRKAGLNPDRDVQFVNVPFPTVAQSLRSNKVAAAFMPQPFYAAEFPKGDLEVLGRVRPDIIPFEQEQLMVAFTDDFIAKHNDVVKAFMSDYQAACKYYAENTQEARKAILEAKIVQVPAELYLNLQDYYHRPDGKIDTNAIQQWVKLTVDQGWSKDVPVDQMVDLKYLS